MIMSNPLWMALVIQSLVFVVVFFGFNRLAWWQGYAFDWVIWVGVQSLLSVVVTYWVKLPPWWLWIQGILPIALWLGLLQTLIPAWGFGLIVLVLALVFSNVWRERVPLYLSNSETQAALVQFAREKNIKQAIDLGSGLGGIVRALARSGVQSLGIEASPVLVWVSNLLSKNLVSARVVRGDIWQADISQVSLVYVFLSPVPMPDIWRKACAEMPEGSWLISNSFEVPEVEPEEIWELSDRRQTQLWLYRIPKRISGEVS